MVIHNVPQDINVENLEETIMTQNQELGLIQGNIVAKFSFRTKEGRVNMVTEVCSDTRKKLLHTKLELGWLICNTDDCLVARRCFKCSPFNHRHQDCKGEETCLLCAGEHKLKEFTAPAMHYKCINCDIQPIHQRRKDKCYSSLDKNCPSLQAVLSKYRLNTDY
jgi:hypothetical protein